jgi:hypothetical protein
MIVCHDGEGRITNILFDPVPAAMREHLAAKGQAFIEHGGPETASELVAGFYVGGEAVVARPACPATVTVSGRTIELAEVPAGSTVSAEIEGETIPLVDTSIEMDEAGPVSIVITPPWPFLEARHALEIE